MISKKPLVNLLFGILFGLLTGLYFLIAEILATV